jgi:hypothetical protein
VERKDKRMSVKFFNLTSSVKFASLVVCGLTSYLSLGHSQLANAQPRPRPDLNGQIVKQPESGRIFWIDEGLRRWIDGGTSSSVYTRLFVPRNDFPVAIDSTQIPLGTILSGNNRLVRCSENGNSLSGRVYFLDQGKKRRVSSPKAMSKNNFNWDRIEPISCPAVQAIPDGATITE